MPDIIQDAKKLLDGATPGKWRAADSDIIAKDGNRFLATVSEYSGLDEPSEEYANVQIIAAAPELAQALAEETYEYAVQVKRGDGWEYTYEPWDNRWQDSYTVQEIRAQRDHPGEETRIVRRRVSPPEVINE